MVACDNSWGFNKKCKILTENKEFISIFCVCVYDLDQKYCLDY